MIRRVGYFVRYLFIFTKHLVLANYQVAKVVLAPTMKIRPGFLAVPMEAASDFEITSLANSITLTPGTISVHVERDAGLIVVHFLDVGNDLDAARANIKRSLEDPILAWTRPIGGSGKSGGAAPPGGGIIDETFDAVTDAPPQGGSA